MFMSQFHGKCYICDAVCQIRYVKVLVGYSQFNGVSCCDNCSKKTNLTQPLKDDGK